LAGERRRARQTFGVPFLLRKTFVRNELAGEAFTEARRRVAPNKCALKEGGTDDLNEVILAGIGPGEEGGRERRRGSDR
jgi:hypothetical protein